jgi:hypothetical protein
LGKGYRFYKGPVTVISKGDILEAVVKNMNFIPPVGVYSISNGQELDTFN